MIHELLSELERDPRTVFYEGDLRSRFGAEFERCVADGFLRRLPLPCDGDTYVRPDGTRYSLRADGAGWDGVTERDGELDVITLGVHDVLRCEVDVVAIASRLREVNDLRGPEVAALGESRRAVLVGEAKGAGRTVFVLGLVTSESAGAILPLLPAMLPSNVERLVVACPTFVPDPTLERRLDSLSIEVAGIGASSLHVQRREKRPSQPTVTFRHSPDFRSINYRGIEYPLTGRRAQAIELLFQAWERGTSSLGQDYVMEEIGSPGSRLRDLFRDSPLWGTLIVPSDAKGTVRLDI